MWFLLKKMWYWNCDFCLKCDFETWFLLKMRFWKCDFLEICNFEHVNFWIKWDFLPQGGKSCLFQFFVNSASWSKKALNFLTYLCTGGRRSSICRIFVKSCGSGRTRIHILSHDLQKLLKIDMNDILTKNVKKSWKLR